MADRTSADERAPGDDAHGPSGAPPRTRLGLAATLGEVVRLPLDLLRALVVLVRLPVDVVLLLGYLVREAPELLRDVRSTVTTSRGSSTAVSAGARSRSCSTSSPAPRGPTAPGASRTCCAPPASSPRRGRRWSGAAWGSASSRRPARARSREACTPWTACLWLSSARQPGLRVGGQGPGAGDQAYGRRVTDDSSAEPPAGGLFVGVDLAWSTGTTGLAAVDGSGTLVSLGRAGSDAEIDEWLRRMPSPTVVAVDAPLVVPNPTGQRRPEREIGQAFGALGASAHASNHQLLGAGGSRALALARRHGWTVDPDAPLGGGTLCLEVYPHPALVGLFSLPYRLDDKKGSAARRRPGFTELLRLLESAPELRVAHHARWREIRDVVASSEAGGLNGVEDEVAPPGARSCGTGRRVRPRTRAGGPLGAGPRQPPQVDDRRAGRSARALERYRTACGGGRRARVPHRREQESRWRRRDVRGPDRRHASRVLRGVDRSEVARPRRHPRSSTAVGAHRAQDAAVGACRVTGPGD